MKNIKKSIVIAVAIITMYQVISTISIFIPKGNIQMIYEVKPGENLQTVAYKFGTTQEKLQQLNNIGEVIEPGQRLKID